MAELFKVLNTWSLARRWSLFVGIFVIIGATAGAGWALLRTPYAVLFSDMKEQDAAVLAQELDKLKVPYQVAAGGRSLLVPEPAVHKTRMTLMGRQLPLNGAVGFELFNNAEFGVSDFVQKVNYLRALQGELSRTILSIEQVQAARVHLAVPEQGLFRKEVNKAKASVTVTAKPGQLLTPGQVLGIQRLVGASVPEVRAEDVTVIDQHGATLSRIVGDTTTTAAVGADPFDAKVGLENLLAGKAAKVIEGLYGEGNALVTVDALLNHQQVKTTTEEVLPAMGIAKGASPTGVIARERSVTRDGTAADAGRASGTVSQDIDYQNGKRVEQVLTPAGAVTRLNVAVVVKEALSEAEMGRVKEVVAASVGLQSARGDVISVQSMAHAKALSEPLVDPLIVGKSAPQSGSPPASAPSKAVGFNGAELRMVGLAGLGIVVVLAIGMAMAFVLGKRKAKRVRPALALALNGADREAILRSVQHWLSLPRATSDV